MQFSGTECHDSYNDYNEKLSGILGTRSRILSFIQIAAVFILFYSRVTI